MDQSPSAQSMFCSYRFADQIEKGINLLRWMCTVSVRTQEIVAPMIELTNGLHK